MDNTLDEVRLKPDTTGEQEATAAAPAPQRLIEFVLPLVSVGVDQATKAMVRASVPVHDSVTVIPGLFDITHALNSGAAFGILNGADFPYKTVIIAVVATAALIGVGMYAASLSDHQLVARIGLALIIGGAAGNLIDRVLTGSVVDVTLTDMAMMGPGGMMGPGMMGNDRYGPGAATNGPAPGVGMMRLSVVPSTVPPGPVSVRVHHPGGLRPEALVLPLRPEPTPPPPAHGHA